MTDEELQKLRDDVAVKVMGWHGVQAVDSRYWFSNGEGEYQISEKRWQPDKDYNQAFMVVVAEMRRQGFQDNHSYFPEGLDRGAWEDWPGGGNGSMWEFWRSEELMGRSCDESDCKACCVAALAAIVALGASGE